MVHKSYSIVTVSVADKVWYIVVRIEEGLKPVAVSPLFDTRITALSALLRVRRDALVSVGKVNI
jgi:hypothetical protein